MRILVTGGAGFIGSAVVSHLINDSCHQVINVDKLTYAGNLGFIASVADSERHIFKRGDISNSAFIHKVFATYQPDAVMHLAAESHVDRSIGGPAELIRPIL